jgi:hypothetical protein
LTFLTFFVFVAGAIIYWYQLDTMRETLQKQERAWVLFDAVSIAPTNIAKCFNVTVQYKNFGKSPAFKVMSIGGSSDHSMEPSFPPANLWDGGPADKPVTAMILAPNQTDVFVLNVPSLCDWRGVDTGWPYHAGVGIGYRDEFDIVRNSWICIDIHFDVADLNKLTATRCVSGDFATSIASNPTTATTGSRANPATPALESHPAELLRFLGLVSSSAQSPHYFP